MWKLPLCCIFLVMRQVPWIHTWLSFRDAERLEVLNFIFTCILLWGGKYFIFSHNFSHCTSLFFSILDRTDVSQHSPSSQVSAGHFRPGFQTCCRLCSDHLKESTPPTQAVPLKVRMELLTIQYLRLCSFFNICEPESVKASFQSWPFPSYFSIFPDTVWNKTFPCRFCSPWLRGRL